jgi:uncharacterized protein YecA (UPF0149 family)
MDVRSGRIYNAAQAALLPEIDRPYLVEMSHDPTPLQRERGRVGRNDPCPCGSGKKFKKCHLFRKVA